MKRTYLQLILLLLCMPLLLTGTGCSSENVPGIEDEPEEPMAPSNDEASAPDNVMEPIVLSADGVKTSERMGGFAFRLLDKAVSECDGKENVAVSPLGAAMVTAMVGNALDPAERGEALTALGVESLEGLNSYSSKMLEALPSHDNTSKLVLANGAWFDTGRTSLSESYRSILADAFKSEVRMADFSSPALLPEINGWVKDKTAGVIPEVLDELPEDALGVWLNTIYFSGLWRDHVQTVTLEEGHFQSEDGSTAKVRMVTGVKQISGGTTEDGAEYSTIDYGNGGFALTLLMPAEGVAMKDFIGSVPANFMEKLKAESSARESRKIVLFPKLDLSLSTDLIEPMKKLGLENAFSSVKAPGMGVKDFYIALFLQKIRVAFDEKGAEMSSASVALGSITLCGPEKPLSFNRPFVYLIWEKSTGAVLLAGTVMDPTAKGTQE